MIIALGLTNLPNVDDLTDRVIKIMYDKIKNKHLTEEEYKFFVTIKNKCEKNGINVEQLNELTDVLINIYYACDNKINKNYIDIATTITNKLRKRNVNVKKITSNM